jgi:hypothetical protein
MANNTKTKARQTHVSPGVYSREVEIPYAVKSLGRTKLALVGETQRGRAFEPVSVQDWTAFQKEFGGLDASKFKGNQYPKYELPYIAKTYLEESNSLSVCRVLGLSGYNAGPAWLITASGTDTDEKGNLKKRVVAVLRARGDYKKSVMFNKNANTAETCACQYTAYDTLIYRVGERMDGVEDCHGVTHYDGTAVSIEEYFSLDNYGNECEGYNISGEGSGFNINVNNLGQFTIKGRLSTGGTFSYPVSLNAADNNQYILNVFGTTPEEGDAPLWVEALYDVNLLGDVQSGRVTRIDSELTFIDVEYTPEFCGTKPVHSLLNRGEEMLTKGMVGMRFLADPTTIDDGNVVTVHPYDYNTNKPFVCAQIKGTETSGIADDLYATEIDGNTLLFDESGTVIDALDSGSPYYEEFKDYTSTPALTSLGVCGSTCCTVKAKLSNGLVFIQGCELGQIYTVKMFTDKDGKRNYVYAYYPENIVRSELSLGVGQGYKVDIVPIMDKLIDTDQPRAIDYQFNDNENKRALALFADGYYYRIKDGKIARVTMDMNNYKSQYRHALTPWLVSQVKGDTKTINLVKLFRFHTINDGKEANKDIKVSIANILPDQALFDVYIRDINDSDGSPKILERYTKCSLLPGDPRFLGYKIGTFDGEFEQKSEYVTVEIAEGDAVTTAVPCGFLGYPTNIYSGIIASGKTNSEALVSPDIVYNTMYDEDIRARKQYFGISDLTGYDIDLFTFKGRNVYTEDATYLGNGFHLDCRLGSDSYMTGVEPAEILVDGKAGYVFSTVGVSEHTEGHEGAPVLTNETTMEDNLYSDVAIRKFTLFFYGAFDGWDVYRDQRTNTDDFSIKKYKGIISTTNGEGRTFEAIQDAEALELESPGITSDYYAYLSGYRQYCNPSAIDINIFATPGIDYVNNGDLVKEVIDMIEEERADSIYVITTPDKPAGASDDKASMYTAQEAADNYVDSDISSNYCCTSYPWVKFEDTENNRYIYLPQTKDIVRDMAYTDNVAQPWFAPVGYKRGRLDAIKPRTTLKLVEEDILYANSINFVKSFSGEGHRIWGQKTMVRQEPGADDTMLSRIAVRRMLLYVRKLVAIACNQLIFDPNDPTMVNQVYSAVDSILSQVKENRGISDKKVKIISDAKSVADMMELNGVIYIKPYMALEYINFDFVLTPEGVSFSDI